MAAYVHYFRAAALDVVRCDQCFFPEAAGVQGDPAVPLVPCKCGALARHAACGGLDGWACGRCA